MCNFAAYMTDISKIELSPFPMPVVKKGELRIKVEAVGICGSDAHLFAHGKIGNFVAQFPFVLGHECAGIVVEVGEQVSNFEIGDRVVMEPGVPCGHCEHCLSGHYNLCDDVVFMATPPYNGCLMNFITHPAAFSFKMPANMSMIEGALVEPLAIGINAALTGGVSLGDTVFISGAGCIGLVCAKAAKAYGASKIIISDTLKNRLDYAEKMGAIPIHAAEQSVEQEVLRITKGKGAHVVIDAAGTQHTQQQTTKLVHKGGCIVFVGLQTPTVDGFSINDLINKEAHTKAIFRYKNLFPTAIKAIASGQISVLDIVTNRYPFAKTHHGFTQAVTNPAAMIKGVIVL